MPKRSLSKTVVDGLRPHASEYIIWDEDLAGFGVRVKPTGVRSYVIQYRDRQTGVSRRKTLGAHGPLLSLHKAKERARVLLGAAVGGADPIGDEKARRAEPFFKELAADYLEQHAVPKKRPASLSNDRSMLNGIILPKLGHLRVGAIKSRDIHLLHTGLKATPYRANRVLSLLSKIFSVGVQWGLRADNPAKGIERYHEDRRERWLSDDEITRLLAALAEHPNQIAANAIRLQLLTGARIGEVLTARWGDIDFERGVWTKPSHHTKQKRTEHLPLSAPALALLLTIKERADASVPFVFPGRIADRPLAHLKGFWKSVTAAAGLSNYRMHDNRHTHASHLVSSGLSLEIVGRLLGHTSPMTTRRYAHLADDPLRGAANRFGAKIAALEGPAGGEVVHFGRKPQS